MNVDVLFVIEVNSLRQIIPFILIAIIVAGALFLLQDNYDKNEFDPIVMEPIENYYWDTSIFLQEDEEEKEGFKFGIQLKATENIDAENIEAIEVFVNSMYENFSYQDLQMKNFNGEIIHWEKCGYCIAVDNDDGFYPFVNVTINWIENGHVRSTSMFQEFNWNDHFLD